MRGLRTRFPISDLYAIDVTSVKNIKILLVIFFAHFCSLALLQKYEQNCIFNKENAVW